ncbi:MAG: DUF262 domain-containing HNH endonuclease family protein [Bdellovibrionales bacterium]|nr:DUF262 domain-containing HNH endonuclease family protein [Bdellovibrionales bacterium]
MSESKLKVQVLEGADNKLDLAKLEDVLKRKLIIPSYQRPYAWNSEDIEEIFQTISYTKENRENICFFGSIILSKKGNGFGQEEYYIIDGQQRLSSFLLILRVMLHQLDYLFTQLEPKRNLTESQIEKKLELKNKKEKLAKIIETVSLKRDGQPSQNEKSILNFIKNDVKDYTSLPAHLDEKIKIIYDKSPIRLENAVPDSSSVEQFSSYINEILDFLDLVLNKIKFCLICIAGKNSEDFAINLFNTLNTTGQPLTAFEVLKSELYTINKELSKKIDEIQSEIIKYYIFKRKKIVTHTGKLLLYLALYRGDFNENNYALSDNKFKDQRGYLKEALNKESAAQLVEDIKVINTFYSNNWLNLDSLSDLLKKEDEKVCFHFLSELKHDRVLPILIRFYKNNKNSLGKCVKVCTAFSSLWRAYCDGSTSGIDKAYKDISLKLKSNYEIEDLGKKLKTLFFKKLSSEEENIEQIKNKWIQKLKTSTIYKNQKLSKLLLFLSYNKLYFDSATNSLKRGNGIDILDIHHWKDSDYKTIEHILPKSDKTVIGHIHTLGNLTLLPQVLNSSLGDKPFSEKLVKYKQFCERENEDKYPYLPIIKHIANYDQFTKQKIEERSKILSEFIWQTLAEDWLGWKD